LREGCFVERDSKGKGSSGTFGSLCSRRKRGACLVSSKEEWEEQDGGAIREHQNKGYDRRSRLVGSVMEEGVKGGRRTAKRKEKFNYMGRRRGRESRSPEY